MSQLPIILIRGKQYYSDMRLKEFRAVNDFTDRITYDEYDSEEYDDEDDAFATGFMEGP